MAGSRDWRKALSPTHRPTLDGLSDRPALTFPLHPSLPTNFLALNPPCEQATFSFDSSWFLHSKCSAWLCAD